MKARFTALVLSAGAVAALALPAAAGAALPKASTTLIVPGKSIGGLALNFTAAQVQKAWGHTKECIYQCSYEGLEHGDETAPRAGASLERSASGKGPAHVWNISMEVGQKKVGQNFVPDFNTALTQYKTAKGIGLGSSIAEVQRAYPGAKKESSAGITFFSIKGKKEISTTFYCGISRKVTSLSIQLHPGG